MSLAWPNVEVLYLVKNVNSVGWSKRTEWALIRADEGAKETKLRNLFNSWKRTPGLWGGKDKKVQELNFVEMLPKRKKGELETEGAQYCSPDRAVLSSDIIVG